MAEVPLSRSARAILAVDRRSDRPCFLPSVGVFPLFDYVLPFLPNQILLAGLSMMLPQRWIGLAVTFVIATALGAALVAAAIQINGIPFVAQLLGNMPEAEVSGPIFEQIRANGLPALVALAMLPWPPRTAVLACAVAGLPPAHIGLAVLTGRIVPAGLIAGLGAKAPRVLRRIASVDRMMREVEAEKRRLVP